MLLTKLKRRENTFTVFIERNVHVSGPAQFKPVLCRGPPYRSWDIPPVEMGGLLYLSSDFKKYLFI